jgi:hypothetical protein
MRTEENNFIKIATYRGRLMKSISEMTQIEREKHYQEATIRTRSYLFSIGQPLIHQKDGHLVAEYSDGKIIVIR